MGEDAAPVDVGHQDHRAVHFFGKAHVGDVAVTQVDFGGAAGAFHQHRLVGVGEAAVALQHGGHGPGFVVVIVPRRQVGHGAAVDDDLGADVGGGLEEHRVHVGVGLKAGGNGLQGLGPADLAPVHRHRRIEGHVLGLEGGDPHAAPPQQAGQAGNEGALAGIGGGALNHQGAGLTHDLQSRVQ